MKRRGLFTKIGCVLLLAVLGAAVAGCGAGKDQESGKEAEEDTKEKENAYVFAGYYVSEDKETIANFVVNCYTDGTLDLKSDDSKSGTWKEDEEKITLNIGDDVYEALPNEDKTYYSFVYDTKIGEVALHIQMRCKVGELGAFTEANRIEVFREEVKNMTEKYDGTTGGIIFYGGSNFVKWMTLAEDLKEFPIYNKSFGGSSDETRRYYAPELLYNSDPDMVVFMSSTNDWTTGKSLEEIIEIKQKFYEEAAAELPNTAIVIMSATPNPLRYFGEYHDGMVACDEWLKEYCDEHENFYFIDCKPALSANNGTEAVPEYWIEDDLHLTEEGYSQLAELMRTELGKICQERNLTWN